MPCGGTVTGWACGPLTFHTSSGGFYQALTGQQRGAESLLNNRIHTFHSSLTLWLQNNYQPQLSSLSGDKMGAIDSLLRKADEDGVRVFGVTPTTLPGRGIGMVATRDLEVR